MTPESLTEQELAYLRTLGRAETKLLRAYEALVQQVAELEHANAGLRVRAEEQERIGDELTADLRAKLEAAEAELARRERQPK